MSFEKQIDHLYKLVADQQLSLMEVIKTCEDLLKWNGEDHSQLMEHEVKLHDLTSMAAAASVDDYVSEDAVTYMSVSDMTADEVAEAINLYRKMKSGFTVHLDIDDIKGSAKMASLNLYEILMGSTND
jgi:hypothetical protein